ncbi:MAG: HAD-IA family hydrolase [Chloroflexi bacterium]|nr:HAD-IA family hydrolase [Chloroflexota bacterium]
MVEPVRAVFFDVGGTLLHPHPSFHRLVAHVCQQRGLPVTAEEAERAEPRVWARIAQRQDRGRGFSISPEQSRAFWLWVYRAYLTELGYPESAATDLPQRLLETFVQLESYRLYPDVLPTLERLQRAHLTLGVISNWEAWLHQLMAHLEIERYFHVSMVSGVTGVEKPDAEIFLRALEAAGVRADEAIHVGDDPRTDLEGAERMGIRGILLDRDARLVRPLGTSAAEPNARPPIRIRSLAELPSLLALNEGGP